VCQTGRTVSVVDLLNEMKELSTWLFPFAAAEART
jgi:hypothetical protein